MCSASRGTSTFQTAQTTFKSAGEEFILHLGHSVLKNEKCWCAVDAGFAREVLTIEQFEDPTLQRLVRQHNTPTAICGYLAPAIALLASAYVGMNMTVEQVDEMISHLSKPTVVAPVVNEVMQYIQTDRRTYINANEAAFKTVKEEEDYVEAWVANYEISAFLKQRPDSSKVSFIRLVQLSELAVATHEELRLILSEETPFHLEHFMVEDFRPHSLSAPFDWARRHQSLPASAAMKAFVTDFKGHFATFVPVVVDGTPTLVLLNTYQSNHLNNHITAHVHRLCFSRAYSDPLVHAVLGPSAAKMLGNPSQGFAEHLDRVRHLLLNSDTFPEVEMGLTRLYPKLSADERQDFFTRACTTLELSRKFQQVQINAQTLSQG